MDRRTVIARAFQLFSAWIAAIWAGVGGRFVLAPLFRAPNERWSRLGEVAELEPGVPSRVEFVERRADGWYVTEGRNAVWVVKGKDGGYDVFDPHCTHLGCPYHWDADRGAFVCPCHEGVFAMDGSVVSGPPPRPLDHWEWKLDDGTLLARAPTPGPSRG